MNQPINFDNLEPARLDLDDPPPSGTQRNRRVEGSHGGCSICAPAPLDEGSHGGCSICGLAALFNVATRQLHLQLAPGALPQELAVTVTLVFPAASNTFLLDAPQIAALLTTRRAVWDAPSKKGVPSQVTVTARARDPFGALQTIVKVADLI